MSWLRSLVEKHSQNAIIASVIGSIFAVGISAFSVYESYKFTIVAQSRQAKIEQIAMFSSSTQKIIEAGGIFISSINTNKEIPQAKTKFNSALAEQIAEVEQLKNIFEFNNNDQLSKYEDAVGNLSKYVQETSNPTQMSGWAESFGHVLDLKNGIVHILYSDVDLKNGDHKPKT